MVTPRAGADTETCATHAEYDNNSTGETPVEVANRYDVYGWLIGDTASGDGFKRGYRTCWAPGERKIVVVYSYDTGGSYDWWVNDV